MLNLEDPAKLSEQEQPVKYKVVYRRRGSDLIFAATKDNRVQVQRYNHTHKSTKTYLHDPKEVEASMAEIKHFLEKEGYKFKEDWKESQVEQSNV